MAAKKVTEGAGPDGQPIAMLVDAGSGRSLLYADFEARVMGAVEQLGQAGLERGACVASYVSCGIAQQLFVFGGSLVGIVAAPIPSPGTADEIATGLKAIRPDAVVVEQHLLGQLQAGIRCAVRRGFLDAGCVPRLVVLDHPVPPHAAAAAAAATATGVDGELELAGVELELEPAVHIDLLGARSSEPVTIAAELESAEWLSKPFLLLLSSGSTGLPKAVEVNHFRFAMAYTESAEAYRRSMPRPIGARIYVTCPSSHAYNSGYVALLYMTAPSACTLIIGEAPEGGVASVINRYKPFGAVAYPSLLSEIIYRPKEAIDWSKTMFLFSGGSLIPPNLAADVKRLLKKPLLNSWGMTETGPSGMACNASISGLIGNGPSPNFDMAIVDPESGKLCPRGDSIDSQGELWVRGPGLTRGYWNNPEKTAELYPFGIGSWMHMRTGDKCSMTADGQVIIHGRFKEMLKVRGQGQVAPAELEGILREHPALADAVVIGRPDQRHDQIPLAFVVVAPGAARPTPQELFAFVDPRVSEYKRLSEIKFVEELPLLYSGKVNRKALQARLY